MEWEVRIIEGIQSSLGSFGRLRQSTTSCFRYQKFVTAAVRVNVESHFVVALLDNRNCKAVAENHSVAAIFFVKTANLCITDKHHNALATFGTYQQCRLIQSIDITCTA